VNALLEAVIVLLVLTNLTVLGSSRIRTCIRLVAMQGIMLGMLPLLAHGGDITFRAAFLAVGTVGLKGIVFPILLLRALREANVQHEDEPFVGYGPSMLAGIGALAVAIWTSQRLVLPGEVVSPLVFPVSLFTILVGLFLIVTRRTALVQVLGYLVLENGIYTFAVVLVGEIPLMVELGVLLDIFVAVFVMGIAIYHISREFDHIHVDQLDTLKG
jgi:hydrogenase-4 component E